jgi:2-hydroxy-6-oxonona-2,4-dienedioate hydrolase
VAPRRPPSAELLLHDVVRRLRPLGRRLARSTEKADGAGMASGTRALLERLHAGGPQAVPSLARSLGLGRQFVQRLANAALAQGFVAPAPNPAHRRSALLALTPRGRAAIAGVLDRERRLLREVAEELSREDLEACVRVLEHLGERLGPRGKRAAPEPPAFAAHVGEHAIDVDGRTARVFTGGHGEPLLLLHGAWGGAALHFGPVWGALAERFRVIAPDLPGLGDPGAPALAPIGAYARWLGALLDALGLTGAWVVGSSFGAAVAARFAADRPRRCLGLVLVNGAPLAPTPRPLKWVGERAVGRRLLRAKLKSDAWGLGALERAFADPARAPAGLRDLLADESPARLEALVDLLVEGGAPATYAVAPLLLWGEEDRLPGSDLAAAHKLHAGWLGSTLVTLPRAGHLPQLERPDAFVEALAGFVERSSALAAAE